MERACHEYTQETHLWGVYGRMAINRDRCSAGPPAENLRRSRGMARFRRAGARARRRRRGTPHRPRAPRFLAGLPPMHLERRKE